jgi:hypothetical protein
MQIAGTRGDDVCACYAGMILQEATDKVESGPRRMGTVIERVK